MELFEYKAHELKAMLGKGEVSAKDITESFLGRIESVEESVGAFLKVDRESALSGAKRYDDGEKEGLLAGIPVGIKDNISVKGMQNTCASKILEGYIAPYDATVTEKIKKQGGVIVGKLNMDEFAMGSSTEHSAFKITRNPFDLTRVPGGSSGGSAASVAAMEVPLSLGTDTGGSVRQPAAYCGIAGLKPTYGSISRYGVTAFGSTLDQVGTLGRDVRDLALITSAITGRDDRDFTTHSRDLGDLYANLSKDIKGKRIALPEEFLGEGLNDDARKSIEESVKVFEALGATVERVSLKMADYSLAAYYIISSAEASSNLARFDGIRYGFRAKDACDLIDLYKESRSQGFGPEVKRRIMLGTYVLSAGYYDAYYKKALKVRKLIQDEYNSIFSKFDAMISPTTPTPAFRIGDKTEDVMAMYLNDIYTVPVNIAGIPAVSIPCGLTEGMPLGLQIMGAHFSEQTILDIAYAYESERGLDLRPSL
ncbi:Asp-tRNA(Asn)/Glu-tRNA(Gln) amidotransferase subunit GatA [Youngiibacter multivorans]|uniref:Glutamyl-tRNA(Gln) amidotransferase subunit A n=1 Tax=Youngiibacter multivorans TaxID=937251 RepID=A0ABS4G6K5_9CLOT|nr:Asp-tRNA(Asn)/Glu-tRNA(Gln) amidotransferase subunit GatA [Youngiibacter multivorans]MBP1920182.1 aspartyl-tRNA(Asn)/glutamyl-tRNA(Gln) amidotransferase subunit A [Youngiibacter multivorans]